MLKSRDLLVALFSVAATLGIVGATAQTPVHAFNCVRLEQYRGKTNRHWISSTILQEPNNHA
jgi:hypothetical protein